jgi:alkanesulfonate monooxygenase SsuD/methylene tetrahydromethanopterin reductase-like flavin-dependent oxidoreductase (luciferase family)
MTASIPTSARGIGLAASVAPATIDRVARGAANAGYQSFWLNNPPGANALTVLGQIAGATAPPRLGVGVLPLSHHPPDAIIRDVEASNLPDDRFYLGIGAGAGRTVAAVAEAIPALRSALSCSIVVAALGPRMCRLAGAEADGVLLNWITPVYARQAVEWASEGAARAGRPVPRLMVYVRTALGQEAAARLRKEAASYEAIPWYGAHFRRMGTSAVDTAIAGSTSEDIQEKLAQWDGVVDEVVLRVITAHDTPDEILSVVEAGRPGG